MMLYETILKMSNDSSSWLPYYLDGSAHECRELSNKIEPAATLIQQVQIKFIVNLRLFNVS